MIYEPKSDIEFRSLKEIVRARKIGTYVKRSTLLKNTLTDYDKRKDIEEKKE